MQVRTYRIAHAQLRRTPNAKDPRKPLERRRRPPKPPPAPPAPPPPPEKAMEVDDGEKGEGKTEEKAEERGCLQLRLAARRLDEVAPSK